ncbi:zinc ribbon domain-containing protein [Dapis sp. BLCC M172]|uniref:zinc ribbon domain-containing protein n=1 Tax=Dapis sp. BLCC M172 TaxID=2975281 RepID=UPI003CEAAFD3
MDRWEPTSQRCSVCGFKGGKKELDVSLRDMKREWTCLNCGTVHDRDVNAAVNILNAGSQLEIVEPQPIIKVEEATETELENSIQLSLFVSVSAAPLQEAAPPQEAIVAGGQSETLNRRRSRRKTGRKKSVANCESSTRPEFEQLSLFE